MAENARNELAVCLRNLRHTGDLSDFTITCNGDTYNVHKAIVCSRSGFFKRAERFSGKESEEGKVDLPEDEPHIVKLIIAYMYEAEYDPELPDGKNSSENVPRLNDIKVVGRRDGRYKYDFPHTCKPRCPDPDHKVCPHHECHPNTCSEACVGFICRKCCPDAGLFVGPVAPGDATQMLLHAKMYEIGDKYDITGLKELAHEKFLRACAEYWDDHHFAPAAHHAFTSTTDDDLGLRSVVCKVISQHMGLLNKPEVIALLHEFNGLATGILELRAKELGWIKVA